MIHCVCKWERTRDTLSMVNTQYVNSHEYTWISTYKPEILQSLVLALETELKLSCGQMSCSIINTWNNQIWCTNNWVSMWSFCHMDTAHRWLQGHWGHASRMHSAFFNHMHRWFVKPRLIEATLFSSKHSHTFEDPWY